MPQPGQGKPVSALTGQTDCELSKVGLKSRISNGTTSVAAKMATKSHFAFMCLLFVVKFVDITLHNHCSNHRK